MTRTFEAQIARVEDVTPAMRRLVLGGAGLAGFRVPAGALGPYLKLRLKSAAGHDLLRTYSVRRHDLARGELHVDMLVHGLEGPGSRFACRAQSGDAVTFGGPGFIPAEPCRDYVLAGDHTALPAIAQIVESLPPGCRARVFVEVPTEEEEQSLASAARLSVTWLHRPAGAASRLAEVVRDGWPRALDDVLVWAGAEAAISRAIRGDARRVRGIPAARCQVLNYWKAGQPEGGFSYVA